MSRNTSTVIFYSFILKKEKLEANDVKCQFCMVGTQVFGILFFVLFYISKLMKLNIIEVLDFQELSRNYRVPCFISLLLYSFLIINILHLWYICYNLCTNLDALLLTKVCNLHYVSQFVFYSSLGFDKYICYVSIIIVSYRIFHKNLLCFTSSSLPSFS